MIYFECGRPALGVRLLRLCSVSHTRKSPSCIHSDFTGYVPFEFLFGGDSFRLGLTQVLLFAFVTFSAKRTISPSTLNPCPVGGNADIRAPHTIRAATPKLGTQQNGHGRDSKALLLLYLLRKPKQYFVIHERVEQTQGWKLPSTILFLHMLAVVVVYSSFSACT